MQLRVRNKVELKKEYDYKKVHTTGEIHQIKTNFRKISKNNKGNFEAFTDLLNAKDQIDLKIRELDTIMNQVRFENREL